MRDLDPLARSAQAGDRTALAELLRSCQADVWRFCAYLTRPDEADDLAQEALTRVVSHLGRWTNGPVRTWIIGVARNVCAEHVRKVRRRRTDPYATPPAAQDHDLTGAIEVSRLLGELTADQRESIVLTQLIGLSYAEAASVMGCEVGTVRSRVARGRSALATALTDDAEHWGDTTR